MKSTDRYFLQHSYNGVVRMKAHLNKDLGHRVNEKQVRRRFKLINLKTVYAKPIKTKRDPDKYIYPCLLGILLVSRPIEFWQTDITDIPRF
ncbi:hypothetical protein OA501_01640 [Flavobacteriaceae bacterium]|nr:hypothetical protein [Flavobacteriaceae bacterium]